jgi:hypothetical protein
VVAQHLIAAVVNFHLPRAAHPGTLQAQVEPANTRE